MKNVFLRETIDTGLLMKICISLDYDFFRHYSALIPFAKSEVEAPKTSQIHAIAKDFEDFVEKAEKIIQKG